ncbi:MAG TPA: class I SAM-dependent methyltransferase [Kangiella sp.]|uniref:class I SAM-dependent methyltransferase n=1 Tax=Kangiella sp. TaxID=1920245 RepID=UPI002F95D15B
MIDNESTTRFWDKLAPSYAKKPIPDEAIYQRKINLTQQHLSAYDEIFEFGCGTGGTAILHAPKVKHIVATDVSPAMIEIAKQQAIEAGVKNASFLVGQIEELQHPDKRYDAVLGLNIMHLIETTEATLNQVHQMLKTGGIFVSSTPLLKNEPVIIRWIIRIMQAIGRAPYIKFLDKDGFMKQVNDAGFEIIHEWSPTKSSIFLIARKNMPTI